MQILCPNCKADSDLVKIDQVDYIQCPGCGWFETQADGSVTACDSPSSAVGHPSETEPPEPDITQSHVTFLQKPAEKSEGGPNESPPSLPPSDEPDDNENMDDEDSINVTINFED